MWGSGREAIADWHDGDYAGAALNGALAVSDVVPVLGGVKAIYRTGRLAGHLASEGKLLKKGAYSWKYEVQPWMKAQGYLKEGEQGHHWLIPQNERGGKYVPEWIKNQPWNITPQPDRITHGRIHHRWKDLERFDFGERYSRGTPLGVKVAVATAPDHMIGGLKTQVDKKK